MNKDGNAIREEGHYFSSRSNTLKDLEPGSRVLQLLSTIVLSP